MSSVDAAPADRRTPVRRSGAAIPRLVQARIGLGLVTLAVVSVVVFAATQVLPGDAAHAILGRSATAAQITALQHQMGLDRPAVVQYLSWLGGLLHGDFGRSLTAREPVSTLVGTRIVNSAALVVVAGVAGTVIGVVLGLFAAVRRDSVADHVLAVTALAVTALPEFVVAIFLIMLFATNVFHVLPGVSSLAPDQTPFDQPSLLVLPTLTLVIVTVPYIFRMMRAATIEALESDYVEMARLKGLRQVPVLLRHALPNAVAPTIQAIGLSFLYLAGGIVIVEVVFNYPGLGGALNDAVQNKDVPTIQFIVMLLAAFYVVVNIASDVLALIATPRRRLPR